MKDSSLSKLFEEIKSFVSTFEVPSVCFYRGVNDGSYEQIPSLFRNREKLKNNRLITTTLENNLYYDFTSYGSGILDVENDWDILFKMQHYGIPTRVLDWSESLGVALYFALNFSSNINNPCIWVLDPYKLNELVHPSKRIGFTDRDYKTLYNPKSDFKDTYYNYFIVNHKKNKEVLFETPQALYPIKSNQRVRAQWGVFTLHGLNENCISKQVPEEILRKFPLTENIIEEAKTFLSNSSINHFSMMPDLEGLQKYLKEYYYK